MNSSIGRRRILQAGGALAALATPAFAPSAVAQAGFDWQRFKGQKIEVSLVKSPRSDILQKFQPEFEALTGITVGSEQIPEQQHRQKHVIEFASGHPGFDVTTLAWHVEKRLFGRGQWLADLRPLLADPKLTAPEFDFADFSEGGRIFATQSDGRIDTFPLSLDYIMLFWNKELFAARGLAAPQTFDALADAAAALSDPAARRYGWVARGLKNANTYVWASMLLGWGTDAVVDGKLATDGAPAIGSATMFAELGRKYGPPGMIGFNWNEAQTSFAQGTAAMWLDSSGFAALLEDPAKSKVAGRVGYGVMPAGPKTRAVGLTGDGIGIAAASPRKEPAYLYLQWASGRANQARFLAAGAGAGARNSIYADPKALAGLAPGQRAWVDCVLASAPLGRPCLPNIVPVTEFRDVFGVALTDMLGGADPAAELRKATDAFRPVLAKSEA